MSHSSRCERGQVEPIAALLALALLAVALTMYIGAFTNLFPAQTERINGDETLTNVWQDIESDGVYEAGTLDDASAVDRRGLPDGSAVYINVTRISDSGRVELNELVYDDDPSAGTITMDPPKEATVVSRAIPIRLEPGLVRSGRLYVAVWSNDADP